MTQRLEPLREGDLPGREKSFWRMTGPGAIMVGMSIGSGELVLWPWITAKFGASMVWAAALGVFVQLWINIEIGRWAVATGESAMRGFARVSQVAIYSFMGLLFIGAFLPGWARATGSALKYLLFGLDGPGSDWIWTALVFLLVTLVLFGPKQIYTTVERSVTAMVIVIVLGMIYVAFRVGTAGDVADMGRGLLNFGRIELDDEFTFMRLFGAFVFAGAGGFGNLFYAYYLRDKGIGMGKRIPALVNPLRGEEELIDETGYTYPETEENRSRFNGWLRYVILDSTLYFWILNTFTMFLFMFGALVVLRPLNIVPAESQLVWDLSMMLENTMGLFGRYLFLVIAMAAMFSSQLTGVDGSVRIWSDMLRTNFPSTRRFAINKLYLGLALTLMAVGIASTWFFDTFNVSVLDFFFISAVTNGFAMAIYVPLILYLNMNYLPVSARPKPLNIVMVSMGALIYIGFAVYTVWNKVGEWF